MTLGIVQFFKDYIGVDSAGNLLVNGIIKLVIDLLLVIALLVFVFLFLVKHTKTKKILVFSIIYLSVYLIVGSFGLVLLRSLMTVGIIMFLGVLVVNYAPEVKSHFTALKRGKGEKGFITNAQAKEQLIDTLIRTVEYLTSRKIGAIITLEKENSLNTYIDKGTKIEANVSFELLATIFWPNTALHDGAVIIRGSNIMCAGTFYPPSENADIPKTLGSRHRAGLGISEVSDAFTIILSEETGNIATTISGTITSNITVESLRVSLDQNILVK